MSFRNDLVVTAKFLAANKPKTLDNGKEVNSFYADTSGDPQYPSTPEFGLYGDKCKIIEGLQKGDEIKIYFNLNGRKYKKKDGSGEGVYTGLGAWKVEKVDLQAQAAQQQQMSEPAVTAATQGGESNDSLPF